MKKSLNPLFLLITISLFFLAGCFSSSGNEHPSRTQQGFQKPPRDRYILWQSCQPGYRCEFLDSFGPALTIEPLNLPPGQRCFGKNCEKLEEYGPNSNRQSQAPHSFLGRWCTGDECEEYEEYGPNAYRSKVQGSFPGKCRGKTCDKLDQYGKQ